MLCGSEFATKAQNEIPRSALRKADASFRPLLRRPTAGAQTCVLCCFLFCFFVTFFDWSPLLPFKKTRQTAKKENSNKPARRLRVVMVFAWSPLLPCKKHSQRSTCLKLFYITCIMKQPYRASFQSVCSTTLRKLSHNVHYVKIALAVGLKPRPWRVCWRFAFAVLRLRAN